MDKLWIIKIGGHIIDNDESLQRFLQSFAAISGHKILVHGGGKLATRMAEQLNIPQQMAEGRRITDAETLKIVTMVYGGHINKKIVTTLQSLNCNAIGITGADGNSIQAHKRVNSKTDFGFAGDVDKINTGFFSQLLQWGMVPVIAPLTHDQNGQILNTNADTIAQEIAKALGSTYATHLLYSFEKDGVLLDVNDPGSKIPTLNRAAYADLKNSGAIFAGMIPKLDNAFSAIDHGVSSVVIGRAEQLEELIKGETGTVILND